jgi:hypothetical protein
VAVDVAVGVWAGMIVGVDENVGGTRFGDGCCVAIEMLCVVGIPPIPVRPSFANAMEPTISVVIRLIPTANKIATMENALLSALERSLLFQMKINANTSRAAIIKTAPILVAIMI